MSPHPPFCLPSTYRRPANARRLSTKTQSFTPTNLNVCCCPKQAYRLRDFASAALMADDGWKGEWRALGTRLHHAALQAVSNAFSLDAVIERSPDQFLGLDQPEISKSLSIFVPKSCAGRYHGVDPETPEVFDRVAPSRHQLDWAEKVDRKRANLAGGARAVQQFIFDQKHPPALGAAFQFEQVDVGCMAFHLWRRPDYILVDPSLTRRMAGRPVSSTAPQRLVRPRSRRSKWRSHMRAFLDSTHRFVALWMDQRHSISPSHGGGRPYLK